MSEQQLRDRLQDLENKIQSLSGTNQSVSINGAHLTLTNTVLFIAALLLIFYSGARYTVISDRVLQQTEIVRDVRDRQAADSDRMTEQEDLFRAWTANLDPRVRELESKIE